MINEDDTDYKMKIPTYILIIMINTELLLTMTRSVTAIIMLM